MKKFNLMLKIRRGINKIVNLFKNSSSIQNSKESDHVEDDDSKDLIIQYEIDSNKIIHLLKEHHYTFTIVPVSENTGKRDQLIEFCINNPDKFILVTANKSVSNKAKTLSTSNTFTPSNVKALADVRRVGGKLSISELNTKNRNICVISKGREYNEGSCPLNIGDDVFIATKKHDYCTFSHFRMISLGLENNCVLVYHTRLYNMKKINTKLPREDYKKFIRSFKLRHDI